MTIDWNIFAERVPVGTRVAHAGTQGILLENTPTRQMERNINQRALYEGLGLDREFEFDQFEFTPNRLRWQPFNSSGTHWDADVAEFKYSFDDGVTWLHLYQVMACE